MFRIVFLIAFSLIGVQTRAQITKELNLPSSTGTLSGTLVEAGSRDIVAIIIAGSGPTDRNGNSPMGVNANSYQLLAEGLAVNGLATLRYDKRGIGASKAAGTAEIAMRFDHLIEDVKLWAKFLKSSEKYKKVVLIGHSEGALVASVAAQDPEIVGLVLLAGMGRNFDEVIAEQIARNAPKQIQEESKSITDSLKAGYTVSKVPSYLYALYRPSVQPYLISLLRYAPQTELKKVDKPVLIIQGEGDLQISVKDAKNLAEAHPKAELLLIPNMDHILKPADPVSPLANYQKPDLALSPELVPAISRFISRLR